MDGTAERIDQDPRDKAGSASAATSSLRRCLASAELCPRHELLRFVVGPDERLVFDLTAKLPGRGLWVKPRRDLVERATKRNLFAKAARKRVIVPEDLVDQVEQALRGHVLGLIGLARRAGTVTLGYEKVRAGLAAGKVKILMQAGDSAAGGRDKLRALAGHSAGTPTVIEIFTVAELSAALGRENAVHVAISPGGLAARIAHGADRLGAIIGAATDTKGF